MASICTIENRLLPLPASSRESPFSVTLFIAANCIEFEAPKVASCRIDTASGQPGDIAANEAIEAPTISVFTSRKLS
ncbi:hypothetical protein D3C71_2104640 [compost metagenome]